MGNSNLLSTKGHRGLIFPGKFLETENFRWARFPKEFPEMCANAKSLRGLTGTRFDPVPPPRASTRRVNGVRLTIQ
eukprot:4817283-Prymnesium_polylepis.1